MYVVFLSVYVYTPLVCRIYGGQKTSNPLELEYQSVRQISDTVRALNSTKDFWKSSQCPSPLSLMSHESVETEVIEVRLGICFSEEVQ